MVRDHVVRGFESPASQMEGRNRDNDKPVSGISDTNERSDAQFSVSLERVNSSFYNVIPFLCEFLGVLMPFFSSHNYLASDISSSSISKTPSCLSNEAN